MHMSMKQITIRGIDEALHAALATAARREGMSMNRWAVQALRRAVDLRLGPGALGCTFHDLDPLFGTWDEADAAAFEEACALQRSIDAALWN